MRNLLNEGCDVGHLVDENQVGDIVEITLTQSGIIFQGIITEVGCEWMRILCRGSHLMWFTTPEATDEIYTYRLVERTELCDPSQLFARGCTLGFVTIIQEAA